MSKDYDELFEALYDSYYGSVYRYIYAAVKDKWNAEDVISTVFTKIYINREKICDVEGSKNWIFKIAHNAIIDHYRKNGKIILVDEFLDKGKQDEGYENILIQDEFSEIKEIIQGFPEETQEMINLRYYGGLKFREISELTNVPENTVKSVISRAIKKIKKVYEESKGGEICEKR